MVVTAPQVTVEEIIDAIARRSQRESFLLESWEYTTLITQVLRYQPGFQGDDYKIEEYALRNHYDRERGGQVAKLWERSRRFENGEVVEDEVDEKLTAEFLDLRDNMMQDMPFTVRGGHSYRYVILARRLVGNDLVYKIGFEPRDRFAALPAGTVWVDCTNWVIRRMEARLTESVPFPVFIESIPVYRLSQERFGDFWFPTEVFIRIKLRSIPLLPIPDSAEVRVSLRDIVINGQALQPQDTFPVAREPEAAPADTTGGFWLPESASNDSLAVYWDSISRRWRGELTPAAVPVTLPAARVDSLTGVANGRLLDLREGRLWRVRPRFLLAPGFNRTQGFVPRTGLMVDKPGPVNPRLDLSAGYAFANGRPVFGAGLELPLLRSRWRLENAPDDGGRYLGARYEVLGLHLNGSKDSALFAGDGRRHSRSFSAFFYGSDPNHYYEKRGLDGSLRWRIARGLTLQAGGGYAEHRPWAQRTGWNLLGRSLRPDGNLAADRLDDRFLQAGGNWTQGSLELTGQAIWHDLRDVPVLGGQAARRELRASGRLDVLDGLGNRWRLRAAYRGWDGPAPLQEQVWLGDHGTLRGYRAGELAGDAGCHASLDVGLGWDLFRALRVPLLKKWGLQPLGFVDWGRTWDVGGGRFGPAAPADSDPEAARGQRLDVGFGFGRRFDLPGLGDFRNLRLYVAHPVAEGSQGQGWRVLLGFEK